MTRAPLLPALPGSQHWQGARSAASHTKKGDQHDMFVSSGLRDVHAATIIDDAREHVRGKSLLPLFADPGRGMGKRIQGEGLGSRERDEGRGRTEKKWLQQGFGSTGFSSSALTDSLALVRALCLSLGCSGGATQDWGE